MKFCFKILIVLAVVNVLACRPPQKKEVAENEDQNTRRNNPDAFESKFDLKALAIQEPIVTKGHNTNPQDRKSMESIDRNAIEPRPKEIGTSQNVINTHPKNRRHRRSTSSGWFRVGGSQVYAFARACETTSTEKQEFVESLFEDDPSYSRMTLPAGCKTTTTTSTRVCPVSEAPMKILQEPPLIVYKRFCETAGQRNSGDGLGSQEHICEQAYLDIRLANQTVLEVESGCVPKFLWHTIFSWHIIVDF